MTIRMKVTALAALLLAACTAPQRPAGDENAAPSLEPEADAPTAPSLFGRWAIAEVNGAPPRTHDRDRQPNVSFSPTRYGGSSGCNAFGGNGLLFGDRWFGEPPMATAIGCGDLNAQETAIFAILSGGPTIAWEGPDAAVLRTQTGRLRLTRSGPPPAEEPVAPQMALAGTRWELGALDGRAIDLPGAKQPARLTFEADRWTLETPCATGSGGWRQEAGAALLEAGTRAARACPAALQAPSEALARAFQGRFRYVVGVNGELVLADGTRWATGRRDITLGWAQPNLLSGLWRIVSVDGAAPPPSERPAEIALGPGAFALWDGCRHSEGVAIAFERKLFTRGSGVVTLANCPADPVRQKMAAVLSGAPRVALAADGGVALVSEAGTLRMQRTSSRPFGTGIETRLRGGQAFEVPFDASGPARLTLASGGHFNVALPCGAFSGRWRNDASPAGPYARFSPEAPPAGCGDRATPLVNFFTGDVLAAIGPNGDIALFVNRADSLPARPVR